MKPSIILLTGPSGSGKTHLLIQMFSELVSRGYPVDTHVMTDAKCLHLANIEDHIENGGRGHKHPDSMEGVIPSEDGGHIHQGHELLSEDYLAYFTEMRETPEAYHEIPTFPFTVTDNRLVLSMFRAFFGMMKEISFPGITFCELAASKNCHPEGSDFSGVDVSYAALAEALYSGSLSPEGFAYVTTCIHVTRSLEARLQTIAEDRTRDVTLIFGEDDFDEIKDILHYGEVPVLTFDNENNTSEEEFSDRVRDFVYEHLLPYLPSIEGARMNPEQSL